MTDPIKAAIEADAKKLEGATVGEVEAEAAKVDAEIAKAVHEMKQRAIDLWAAEVLRAHAEQQRALAWVRAKRAALLGIGIGLLLIVLAHYV